MIVKNVAYYKERKVVKSMMANLSGSSYGGMMAGIGFWGALTWILVVIFLILGIVYFWKEINKKR